MKKEKYVEKVFREYEERFCAKHCREKFLKRIPRLFVCYAVASALSFLLGTTVLVFGIGNISLWYFSRETLIVAGAMIVITIIVMTFLILPPYWKLAKKCKAERHLGKKY
jgi:membrane protein YdbS with pleckstrin-like domain